MKIVVASGYFDPLHIGHIEYLENARKLGDKLIVLVNSDKSAVNKKGYSFMKEEDRLKIVESLSCVDQAYIADDCDGTVANSLAKIKPQIFAKGGDRNLVNLPDQEIEVCRTNNIEIICGLGNKIRSSSTLVENGSCTTITKPWGELKVVYSCMNYKISILSIYSNSFIELHKHKDFSTEWLILDGNIEIQIGCYKNKIDAQSQKTAFIPNNIIHGLSNKGQRCAKVVEIQRSCSR